MTRLNETVNAGISVDAVTDSEDQPDLLFGLVYGLRSMMSLTCSVLTPGSPGLRRRLAGRGLLPIFRISEDVSGHIEAEHSGSTGASRR